MTNEELKEQLLLLHPAATFDESGEWLNVTIDALGWKSLANALRGAPFQFDFLFCLTCIDWKTHFTMVYHLRATERRHDVVFKTMLDRNNPEIETVCHIWRTAEMHEREVFDLFGVVFKNHPDLRRLILTDDFEGYPLRKDFEDPVNMIRL
jgi:NADH:ubiquinone oxidoreductase subunit C